MVSFGWRYCLLLTYKNFESYVISSYDYLKDEDIISSDMWASFLSSSDVRYVFSVKTRL